MNLSELRSLPEFVTAAAREFAHAVALKRAGARSTGLTFADLAAGAGRGAARLRAIDAGGQPTLFFMEGRPEWALGLFSILHSGGVAVPLAAETPPRSLAAVAAHTGCRSALCSEQTARSLADIPGVRPIRIEGLCAAGESADCPSVKRSDLALLVFTSGSTQQPRAVELTHGNLLADLDASLKVRHEGRGIAALSMLPPAHMFELMAGLLAPLARGGSVVYAGSLLPNRLVDALREESITHALAVPALVDCLYREVLSQLTDAGLVDADWESQPRERIAQRLRAELTADDLRKLTRDVRQRIGDSFQTLVVGGAAIDPALAALIAALGIGIETGYGLTEAGPVVSVGAVGECPPGSVGRPLPGVEVRVDEAGEILVRGPNVMRGYFKDPAGTADAVRDGWLHTGDCGRLDADGFLYVVGRRKEAIVTAAGRTVYPEEVEPYYRHPLFGELCVAGVRGEHGNDVPVLFVVPASAAVEDGELQAAFLKLRADAPQSLRVDRLQRMNAPLPRTPAGKIRRRLVADGCR